LTDRDANWYKKSDDCRRAILASLLTVRINQCREVTVIQDAAFSDHASAFGRYAGNARITSSLPDLAWPVSPSTQLRPGNAARAGIAAVPMWASARRVQDQKSGTTFYLSLVFRSLGG
jgi:hypothetical protein